MKVRLNGPSIRLRLTQGEVASLARGESVSDATPLAGGSIEVRVEPAMDEENSAVASLQGSSIAVSVPAASIKAWADSTEEGLYADQAVTGANTPLRIAIEKDYDCIHKPKENVDTFPNPAKPRS